MQSRFTRTSVASAWRRTLFSASWTIRRTSASVRGGQPRDVALDEELRPDPEPVGEVVDVRVEHLRQRRATCCWVDAQCHDRLACVGQSGVERAQDFLAGRPRRVLELRRLDDPPLLELCVPQVLRQPIMDLAREARPLRDAGTRGVNVAQPAQFGVRPAESDEVRLQLRLDPKEEDRGEHQSEDVARRDHAGRHDGIHREMQLAEGGNDETDGEERMRHQVLTEVQPPEQQ